MYMLAHSKDVPHFSSVGNISNIYFPASFLILIHKVGLTTVFSSLSIVSLWNDTGHAQYNIIKFKPL
jgi:hypothetical protein